MDSSWDLFNGLPIDPNKPDNWDSAAFLFDSSGLPPDGSMDTTMFDDAFGSPLHVDTPELSYAKAPAKATTVPGNPASLETEPLGLLGGESSRSSPSSESSSRDSSELSRNGERQSSAVMDFQPQASGAEADTEKPVGGHNGLRDSGVVLGGPFDTLSLRQVEDVNTMMSNAFDFDSAAR
jgi:hypothetical protein